MKHIYIKILFVFFYCCLCNKSIYAQNYPDISISVDKTEILKDGGEATVTISLSKKSLGNSFVNFSLKYAINGSGSENYDFKLSPRVSYYKFAKNETSISFKIKGIYQKWGSENVNLDISIYNIKNATISGSQKINLDIRKVLSSSDPIDTEAPVFQNSQSNLSVFTDANTCGALVDYTMPTATDDTPVSTEAISGYNYLGLLNGHSYYYSNSAVNATTAIQNSIDLGGHLVSIGSQVENDFVDNRIGSSVWIGFTDTNTEGDFKWLSNEPVSYTNWNGAEPNNAGGEDYTEMYTNGRWNDLRGTNNRRYIVEFQPVFVTQTAGLPSGSNFPVGTTTNTFVATDNSGNTSTHSFNVVVVDNEAPSVSQLTAEYYDGKSFNTYKESLLVDEINYSWGSGAPESSLVGTNNFSIRFLGTVQAPQTGVYTFYTTSDDGVRLWVNGISVVNNWTNHGTTVNTGTISLTAGEVVPLKLEFFENGGAAVIKLEWSGPGLSKQFVRQAGVGTCKDVTLDLSATGSAALSVADVDPGYTDACGIASRVLSQMNFTCNDAGDNPVTLVVTDVHGNSASCDFNVTVVGAPDNSLSVTGDTKCDDEDASVTIQNSELGVSYSLYFGATQIGVPVNGTGTDLNIAIAASDLPVGNNLITIKASKGACELNLLNNATVLINPKPNPVGIFHE